MPMVGGGVVREAWCADKDNVISEELPIPVMKLPVATVTEELNIINDPAKR